MLHAVKIPLRSQSVSSPIHSGNKCTRLKLPLMRNFFWIGTDSSIVLRRFYYLVTSKKKNKMQKCNDHLVAV